jgi:2-oxoglutarate ferredoxin oxidoreductase subunit delta
VSRSRPVTGGVRVLTYISDRCHTRLQPPQSIITLRFGEFYRPERGDPVAKGRVSIVVERCKACGFCVEFCPTRVLALSSAFNSKGYHPPHVVHPEKCSGCDLCGMYCPDFAIFATKVAPAGGGDK